MLKLVDNVDIKKLKDYGFTYNYVFSKYTYDSKDQDGYILVYKSEREVIVVAEGKFYVEDFILDKLYELITDGIIEKVDEDE